MVPKKEDKVEKYIGGLSDNIQGNVIVVEHTKLQDAIRVANNLMDQKLKGYAIKNAENKRRFDSNSRDNHGQQQPFKRQNVNGQNVARAYTVRNNVERKRYAGVLPYCNKCRMHHEGPCMARCGELVFSLEGELLLSLEGELLFSLEGELLLSLEGELLISSRRIRSFPKAN
ncbi:hypothetical protein Tco_0647932 [Tanacetum coccineum]